ncbi:Abi family protein [Teichococcus aestuarii]|uniref:Abortive phage resistance protein n=1 Tax=Teichococcus aestuarii TaxID=568898 RepID=A0A2U1UYK0_9PROT|nr:Abi family protein [Pseudoroseomonas aestuarii]PWC26738.1 abortive phage resistance protein [Pseudoroseomonas aestuarii]
MSQYRKPYLPVPDQLVLLQSRGMTVSQPGTAEDCLKRVGYYRLSAYWYPFRRSIVSPLSGGQLQTVVHDDFMPGTQFSTVFELYVFDKKLRLLMLDALERVEIALRTDVALLLGPRDPAAHRNPALLHGNFAKKVQPWNGLTGHQDWLKKLDEVERRSKADFVLHFRAKYPASDLPIWMSVELWDFGMLSRFLSGLTVADQLTLAARYQLPRRELLASWMKAFNFVRNVSAHHARLWNQPLIDQPKPLHRGEVPLLDHLVGNSFAENRLYAVAAGLRFMLQIINPGTHWPQRLKELAASFPANPHVSFDRSGFPAGWDALPLWR